MKIELAQVITEFPWAVSFAIAGGITAFREGRRRASLNEAVHELRRPLQVLSLSLPADSTGANPLVSSLQMAAAAVERLEREINGELGSDGLKPTLARPLVEAAVERWQPHAALAGKPLTLRWKGENALVHCDEIELGQALDNLISNGFEHGDGEVAVEVREVGGFLRLVVRDRGSLETPTARGGWRRRWARFSGRSRHGHGLRVVRRVAARHGGSFELHRSRHGTEARLELPLGEAGR